MNEFKGLDRNVLMLLELNKFNDNKDFYESVKEEIKQGAIVPMRKLASDLCDELYAVDSKMNLIPTKMVSRIRRDTRFSKNKQLYRSNVWCMFMRDKHAWEYQPCMWFEFFPESYNYGIGIFRTDAKYLECYRQVLSENQDEFRVALRSIEIANANLCMTGYKKEKPGTDKIAEDLKKYYNAKDLFFVYTDFDMERLFDERIKEELIYAIRAFAPMYRFLIKITERLYEKGE